MKKITLFLFALFTCWQINAQVSSYGFSHFLGTYTENSASATAISGVRADTFMSTAQNIGFDFVYDGITYTQFKMSSNGFISLNMTGTSSLTTNDLSAANAASRPIIAPLWDDLDGATPTTSLASYEITGTAPNRVLTVEWRNWEWNWNSGATPVISFQLKLYETTNIIDFVYRQEATAVASGSATIGIGSATGSGVGSYLSVSNVTTPAVSSTTSTNSINTKPATGQVFRFTPPTPCTGTPVAGTVAPATQTLLSGQASAALTVSGQTSGVSSLTYQWEQSTDGTNWVNAVGGTGATTLSYTPPVFGTSMIMYRLRITCTTSTETAVSTVATLNPCGALSVPTLETLDVFLPACWQEADNGDLTAGPATFFTGAWVADGFGNVGTTGAMRINLDATGDNDWVLSPLYTIPVTGYELKFDASANQWGSTSAPTTPWEADDFVQVLVSTGTTNWTILYTYDNTNVPSNTGTPNIIDLDAYAGQTIRFAFRGVEGANNGGADIEFIVDNFQIRLTPPCIEPTTLTATSITSNGANLSWVDPSGIQFDYEYVVQLAGGGVPTVAGDIIDITTLPLTVNTLNPNTNYEFWVRANCGVDGNSAWVGPVTFRTLCATFVAPFNEPFATNTFPSCWSQTGPTAWEFGSPATTPAGFAGWGAEGVTDFNGAGGTFIGMDGSDNTNGEISSLLTPFINVSPLTTPRLKYAVFGNNTNDAARNLLQVEVWDGAAWNLVNTVSDNLGPNWVVFTTNLSTLTITGPIQIRFTVTGNSTGGSTFYHDILIDDVTVEETPVTPPACATNVVATPHPTCGNFNNTISWDAVSGADGYNLTIGTTPGGNNILNNQNLGSSITYAFAGTVNTTYYYTVTPYNANGSAIGCIERTFTTNVNGCYCIPTYSNGGATDDISNVAIGSWSNASVGNDAPYYQNFTTSQPATVAIPNLSAGTTVILSVTMGSDSNQFSRVWIDFNQNLTFEPSESFSTGTNAGASGTSNISITIPSGATLGQAVMRIRGGDDSAILDTQACGATNSTWGQTEDYFVNIVAATCTPPAATTTLVPACGSSQYSIDVNVTALGSGTPSITDGTSSWPVTAIGVVNVGPFASGSSVTLTLLHGSDATCNLPLGLFNYSCPPSNDECANATTLTPGGVFADNDIVGTNAAATSSTGAPAPGCASYAGGDVWYQVTVPPSGSITIETNNNSSAITDTGLAVYSGSCGTLTLVECDDDDSLDGAFSIISLTGRTPGEVLYVRVWEYAGGSEGTFLVSAYDASLSSGSFDNANFSAYPNPVKDVLNVTYSTEISSIRVINMIGQEVISKNINATSTQVDMSQLSAGTYIVNVTVGDNVKTLKVVKQ